MTNVLSLGGAKQPPHADAVRGAKNGRANDAATRLAKGRTAVTRMGGATHGPFQNDKRAETRGVGAGRTDGEVRLGSPWHATGARKTPRVGDPARWSVEARYGRDLPTNLGLFARHGVCTRSVVKPRALAMSRRTAHLVGVLAAALFVPACGEGPAAEPQTEDALINGRIANASELRSVVRIDEACTATLVAPRILLTASHCVRTPLGLVSPSYAPGRELSVETRKADGQLVLTKVKIEVTKVHPRLAAVCAAESNGQGCANSSAKAARDAPDIAIIKLAADLPNAAVTPISTAPPKLGELVSAAGFGCSDKATGGKYDDKLRAGPTPVVEATEAGHPGSPVTPATAANLAGVYLFTEGPSLHGRSDVAALCPGDSGGPAFRNGELGGLVLVGVSSSYTFPMGATATVPATNWFSRVDVFAKHEVFMWLEKEGAKFSR